MSYILSVDQQTTISVSFQDAQGNPATVDGIPVWSTSDDTLLQVIAAADGMSAVASGVGPLGSGQVNCTADADLGTGVVQLIGSLQIDIVGGMAATVTLTPGPAEPLVQVQPVAP